jgi:hypothetical protein
MGECPPGHSIERRNVNGPYSPENCTWLPRREQPLNRRNNIRITIDGETKILSQWCHIHNLNYRSVHDRIFKLGWDPARALRTPI